MGDGECCGEKMMRVAGGSEQQFVAAAAAAAAEVEGSGLYDGWCALQQGARGVL